MYSFLNTVSFLIMPDLIEKENDKKQMIWDVKTIRTKKINPSADRLENS